MQNWLRLAKYFPNIITKEKEISFIDELDSFSLSYKAVSQEHLLSQISIVKRWYILSNSYPILASLAKVILVILYSTSQVETVFPEFKALKTCYRNRLTTENLEASVLGEQFFKSGHIEILPEMVHSYFDHNLRANAKKENNKERLGDVTNDKDASKVTELTGQEKELGNQTEANKKGNDSSSNEVGSFKEGFSLNNISQQDFMQLMGPISMFATQYVSQFVDRKFDRKDLLIKEPSNQHDYYYSNGLSIKRSPSNPLARNLENSFDPPVKKLKIFEPDSQQNNLNNNKQEEEIELGGIYKSAFEDNSDNMDDGLEDDRDVKKKNAK